MAEFVVNGTTYRSRAFDGEMQLLVTKRLLPTFTALVGCKPLLDAARAKAAEGDEAEDADGEAPSLQDLLLPVARELAALKDADVTFILNACLDVTQRQAGLGAQVKWVGVRQGDVVQVQADGKFAARILIAWNVLGENFGEVLGSFGLDVSKLTSLAPLG